MRKTRQRDEGMFLRINPVHFLSRCESALTENYTLWFYGKVACLFCNLWNVSWCLTSTSQVHQSRQKKIQVSSSCICLPFSLFLWLCFVLLAWPSQRSLSPFKEVDQRDLTCGHPLRTLSANIICFTRLLSVFPVEYLVDFEIISCRWCIPEIQ